MDAKELASSLAKLTPEQIQLLDSIISGQAPTSPATPTPKTTKQEAKPLRWWRFSYGPFEAYVSNYRCWTVEEALEDAKVSMSWALQRSSWSDPELKFDITELSHEDFTKLENERYTPTEEV